MSGGRTVPDDEFIANFPTPDAYLAYHQRTGHICCGCVNQDPPLPCCNPGHDEATRILAEFDAIAGHAE